ncbi:uncharacterized protein [Haliotis asinina]|uniref:uncharacterized protein n=1 Tax=Haliotis asinina TaxID=109174 RepID=UPI0035326447
MEKMMYKTITLLVLLTVLQSGKCEDYLVAVGKRGKSALIRSKAGETGGLVEIQYPRLAYRRVYLLGPFRGTSHTVSDKMEITKVVENAAIIVSGSDEDINILVDADGIFSPHPISALGTKYILPSSLASDSGYRSMLLIATHNMSTTVDIFFRMNRGSVYSFNHLYKDGDKLSLKLNPYQTLRIFTQNDLNGTVITSKQSVAVYSGIEYSFKSTVYDQLLPVKHYGQEFVVAIDDFNLELQIISEHSHVQITFSSGSTVSTGERRLYNRTLERGENLHFTTTSPVLVTLSRADGYNSSFTTVPPVHSYVTHRSVWLYYNNLNTKLKILTDRRATVLIKDSGLNDHLTWVYIVGSRYKVGTLEQSQFSSSTAISSDFPFTVLSFYNGSVYNIGYNSSMEVEEEVHYSGPTYLVALAGYTRSVYNIPRILASAGETGGQWQVQDPHSGRVWSRRFNPYNTDSFYPPIHEGYRVNLFLVRVQDDAIQIKGGMNYHTLFSPLPVSALGAKYIMSSCFPTTDNIYRDITSYLSILVIATHSKKADIDVIFRVDGNVTYAGRTYIDGDTLSVRLDRYQTFSLNSSSDMTRTIVTATETIAVYSGTYDVRDTVFTTFEQLLPVKHFGHEYILGIQDPFYHERTYVSGLSYQLQVVSHYSDTGIMFNNGSSISVGEDGVYYKRCGNNETFYFNTTRPVMATLCTLGINYYPDGLVVVPPVNLYTTLTTQQAESTLQIVTNQANGNLDVQNTRDTFSTVFSLPVKWKNVPGTRFKVGTLSGDKYTTTIRSNVSFAVFGYNYNIINNGGYSFRTYPNTGTSVSDGTGNKLDTTESFQENSASDGIRNKLNTGGSLQAGSSNNAAVIVGVVCGIVIVAILVAFITYVFYVRRTTIPAMKTTEQSSGVLSNPMNIYVLSDRVAGGAATKDTYTELMYNDINAEDSTPTFVNMSNADTNAIMNQQC